MPELADNRGSLYQASTPSSGELEVLAPQLGTPHNCSLLRKFFVSMQIYP